MSFAQAVCNEEVFDQLALPPGLRGERIGQELIFDLRNQSALIPHPYHYSDYPDRSISFFVRGKHFSAREHVKRSDGPDRVEVWFDADVGDSLCQEVVGLLADATEALQSSASRTPIVVHREVVPEPRRPRPAAVVIAKLNRFCEDLNESVAGSVQAFDELTIQTVLTVVLLPEELESLQRYTIEFGWNELSLEARSLVREVFRRAQQDRGKKGKRGQAAS